MIVAVPRELFPSERRVALVPSGVAALLKEGHEARIERGAGIEAGFTDESYQSKGAVIVEDRAQLIAEAQLIAQVRTHGANPHAGAGDLQFMKPGQILLGFADPLTTTKPIEAIAAAGVTLLAMELIPRISRAQGMDALSSQANLVGYKAVIRAADAIGKIFPMLMTAAGTIQPVRVFVIGAGVAGLQAIATAKRLGGLVSGFDVRPAVKEQVESLGAKFIELPITSEGKGGYAGSQSEEQLRLQQGLMSKVIAESDVVITTALIPGQKAPTLITRAMAEGMKPGSVIVDLAAERGGNCELTQPGRTIVHNGITFIGDDNPASSVATDASTMYSGNIIRLLKNLQNKEKQMVIDLADEITAGMLVCRDGQIVHPRVKELIEKERHT